MILVDFKSVVGEEEIMAVVRKFGLGKIREENV